MRKTHWLAFGLRDPHDSRGIHDVGAPDLSTFLLLSTARLYRSRLVLR